MATIKTIEDYSKHKKEKEREEAGIPKPEEEPKGPTVKEILKSGEQSRLFGAYLKEQGSDVLGEKIIEGNWDDADMDELLEHRKAFIEILETTKNISEKLNTRNIEELIASSPELKKIGDLVGSEGIRDTLTRSLADMAIQDPERFKKIGESIAQLEATKKERAEKNKEIAEICKKYGMSTTEYFTAIQNGDRTYLAGIVEDNMGFWSKLKLRMSSTKSDTFEKFLEKVDGLDKGSEVDTLLADLDNDLKGLGGVLQTTLMENETANQALKNQLRQEKPEQSEPDMSFSEMNNARKKDTVGKAWETFKKKHPIKKGYTETKQKSDFSTEYQNSTIKGKKKGGFWTEMFKKILMADITKDLS